MSKSFLYVANWKMELSHQKALQLARQIADSASSLNAQQKKIILCPSFTELSAIAALLKNSDIELGAQDCSRHRSGAYMGEISAQTLAEIGATSCIVGHSERRTYHHETDIEIAAKVERLLEQKMCPIVCVGETKHQFEHKQTQVVLQKQLDFIFTALTQFSNQKPSLIIAYEPVWSIGTGIIPNTKYLTEIFTLLYDLGKEYSFDAQIKLLYGGSVNETNIALLKEIPFLDGFLIGGASLDFQKFKNIVS